MVARRGSRGSSVNKLRSQSGPISLQALEPRMMFDGAGVVTAVQTFESNIPAFASNLIGGADTSFFTDAISAKDLAPEASSAAAIDSVSDDVATELLVPLTPERVFEPVIADSDLGFASGLTPVPEMYEISTDVVAHTHPRI